MDPRQVELDAKDAAALRIKPVGVLQRAAGNDDEIHPSLPGRVDQARLPRLFDDHRTAKIAKRRGRAAEEIGALSHASRHYTAKVAHVLAVLHLRFWPAK